MTLKKFLPFFSYALHPIFVPLLGTLFYVWLDSRYMTFGQYMVLFLQVIIITFFLPIAFFYLLRTFGRIDSIMLSDLSHRKIPLVLHICLLSVLIQKSITAELFPSLHYFFLGGIVSAALAFLLLYAKIKASIHMIGISALTVFTIGLSLKNELNTVSLVAFLVVLNGLVASSRLVMKAHTNKELLIGFFCGILPQTVLLYFWL
jgi:hypothetical protein